MESRGFASSGTGFAAIMISLWIMASLSNKEKSSSMGKLSKKKRPVADTVELDIQEDGLEDEIIDLVDLVEDTVLALETLPKAKKGSAETLDVETGDENSETMETDLDMFIVDEDELDDTLDDTLGEELMGSDIGVSNGTLTSENDADLSFESALLELFESTDSLAAKLIAESSQTEENDEGTHVVDQEFSGNGVIDQELAAEPTDERDGTREVIEFEAEHHEDLFVDLKLVKGDDRREAGASQIATSDREPEVKSGQKNWLSSGKYYPVAVTAIDKKMAEHEQEMEKLVAEKKNLKKIYEHLRSILYLEGEELKKAVTVIFAKYWSLKLSFMNPARRAGFNENILIKYYDRYILVKIKATKSVYPSHRFISQLWQDLYFSGLGAKAVGALIVNYNTGSDPQDRSLAYADEDEDQLDDLIFIDTRVLFKLTTAIVDEHLSVEDAKKILFRKGRVEFDSTDSTY